MLKITPTTVRTWADEIGITDLLLAELDFHLVHILDVIAKNTWLEDRLYLKGGTAINKLYLKDMSRLSVDLDFNHIGPKDRVLSEKRELSERLIETTKSLDNSHVLKIKKKRYALTRIHVTYQSIVIDKKQHIKIETSHVERFPILHPVKKKLHLPMDQKKYIMTYTPEELIATKIRAFHDRRKGRDVYDLWSLSRTLNLDKVAIRKLFLYYYYQSRKVFNPKLFFPRLKRAIEENEFIDDVTGFIRANVDFNLKEEIHNIIDWLGFLSELDETDRDFLHLARVLLGKGEIPKNKREEIALIEYPLKYLFKDEYDITQEASQIKTRDIMPYLTRSKKRKRTR